MFRLTIQTYSWRRPKAELKGDRVLDSDLPAMLPKWMVTLLWIIRKVNRSLHANTFSITTLKGDDTFVYMRFWTVIEKSSIRWGSRNDDLQAVGNSGTLPRCRELIIGHIHLSSAFSAPDLPTVGNCIFIPCQEVHSVQRPHKITLDYHLHNHSRSRYVDLQCEDIHIKHTFKEYKNDNHVTLTESKPSTENL